MSNRDKVIEVINHYQDALNRYVSRGEEHKILHSLNKLRVLPITVSHLEETGIGRTVNSLRKVDGDVGEGARTLVNQWKEMVEQDTHDNDGGESDKDVEDMEECIENEQNSSQNEVETCNINPNIENKYSSSSEKVRTQVNGDSSERHKKEKHERKYNESSRTKKHEDTSNVSHKSTSKSTKRKHDYSQSTKSVESAENSEDSDDRKKRKSDKYDETCKQPSPAKSENKHSNDKYSSKKSDRHKDSKDKSGKHSNREIAVQSPKLKENSHTSRKESQKDKHREKEKSSSKKESKSRSSKKEETRKSDKEDKRKEFGESSKSDKQRDSKSSIKTSKVKDKIKTDDCIDSGSGASFAEALGMLEPLPVIKSAKKKLSYNKNNVKKSITLNTNEEASTSNSNKKSSTQNFKQKDVLKEDPHFLLSVNNEDDDLSANEDDYNVMDLNDVPALLSNPPKLDPLEINISSLLPTITPNYRPVPNNPLLNENPRHKSLSDYENLSNAIASKNARTKVYSGNKMAFGKLPSLFELCTRILMDNIDAIEYTGGIPFMILKPVLEKCTPDQLMNFEHFNAYVIEDTDDLWNFHCQREFRNKKREEWESWREMYIRCFDEREVKLRALTANIKESQDKSLPVRQTKLAYVDSVVKPPRGVARKQLKNGYVPDIKRPLVTPSSRLSAIVQSGSAGQVSVPNPGPRAAIAASSNAIMKVKKAPLMQKTLQLMKGRFRR